MTQSFSPSEFIQRIAQRLVAEFEDAGMAGHPGLIGSAKEHPARKQLERLLPKGTAVGSGLVFDTFGNVSKQQDIVIYDSLTCPVFSINDTPEATYFPCEGVIAVGEVKSTIGQKELDDSFEKIASVKRLRRFARPSATIGPDLTVAFRSYGSATAISGTAEEQYDQDTKATDQIYGFVLCASFALAAGTMHVRATERWKSTPRSVSPNLVVSLKDGFLVPLANQKLALSALEATGVAYCAEAHGGFPYLIDRLMWVTEHGRTVERVFVQRYLRKEPDKPASYQISTMPI